jgi:polyisoprenoid-binding protein YceI
MKIFKILIIVFLSSSYSFGQTTQWRVDVDKSYIQYQGSHTLHDWEGTNSSIYGLAVTNKSEDEIKKLALLAYVRDFDSQNSGRDSHSLEVLEALKFPEIKFYSESVRLGEKTASIEGYFEFHGVKIDKTVMANFIDRDNSLQLKGSFQLVPTDFGIELPSFMMVKMKDLLQITYSIVLIK